MDIDDANAEMNEQYVIAQEQTVFAGFEPEVYVFDYHGFAIGEVVDPNTLEALALSNQMRIMQINNMLQSNPERIPAVEAVLGISGYMGS
jgi:anthranilate/para-aminobenzoate synthase component II